MGSKLPTDTTYMGSKLTLKPLVGNGQEFNMRQSFNKDILPRPKKVNFHYISFFTAENYEPSYCVMHVKIDKLSQDKSHPIVWVGHPQPAKKT